MQEREKFATLIVETAQMKLTRTDIYNAFYRNTQNVGSTDPDLLANFNYQLGIYYQIMLAKLKNYKTYISQPFTVGMNVLDLTTGAATVGIAKVTSSGTTVTVTTGLAHGITNGDTVIINNVVPVGIYTGISPFTGVFVATALTSTTFTYTIAASQNGASGTHAQYYPNPPGYVTSDGIVLSVGSVNYSLKLISAESVWEQLNSVLLQASAVPQFYYPRRDDFGIWPIPQNLYNGQIYYHYRDRNLMTDDYTAGSVAVTASSNQVVGTTTVFTPAMVGMWFTIDDLTVPGHGYFYRITGRTSNTVISLNKPFAGTTTSGITKFRIGECPEIPDDLHTYLVDGVTGGYYKDIRKDKENAATFLNTFWTGNPANAVWKEGGEDIIGGLLGGMKAYADREDERVINRKPGLNPLQYKAWSVTLA